MGGDGSGLGAIGEAVVVLTFLEDLPDPRQRTKVLHPLNEVLLLFPFAVLAGAETTTDIAPFGHDVIVIDGKTAAALRLNAKSSPGMTTSSPHDQLTRLP